MKKFYLYNFICSILFITTVQAQPAEFEKIYQNNINAIVLISTYNSSGNLIGQGTGFIVREDGYIITNYHVIIGACSINVKLWDERTFSIQQTDVHESIDVALLKINAQNLPVVKLGDIKTMSVNDSVLVLSNPGGIRNIHSSGKILDISSPNFKIDAIVTHGSSGGPVFNNNGYVIGFIVAGIKNSLVNTAIVINEAKNLLDKNKLENFVCNSDGEVDQFLQLGDKEVSKARWNEALSYFSIVLQIEPDNLEAHLNIAQIHQERGFYQLAILRYEFTRQNILNIKDKFEIARFFFNKGICYYNVNLYDEAAADFESVLKLGESNLRCKSFYNLYLAYYFSDRCDLAIKNFYQALHCSPELILPDQWSRIGDCYLKLDQLDSAEAVIGRLEDNYLYLSNISIQKGDTNKAIEILKMGTENNPLDFDLWSQLGWAYLTSENYTEAINALNRANQIKSDNKSVSFSLSVAYLNLSYQYLNQNNFSKCLETLKQVAGNDSLKIVADNIRFEVYSAIAVEEYNIGNYTAAIDTLKLALNINRDEWRVWYNLGLAYSANKENEEALISFTEASKLGDDTCKAKAYLRRGSVYIAMNQPQRAIEDFEKALILPETVDQICLALVNMGEESLNNEKYSEAIDFANSALQYNANSPDAYFLQGRAFLQMENLYQALYDLVKIERSSNIFNRASCVKAQIFASIGVRNFNDAKYQAAEDTLKLAIHEISDCDETQFSLARKPEIWNMLGVLYSETQRYIDAINAFSKAIETNPEYPQYWYRRGFASHKLEEQILARRDLRTALELDPEYADAHRLLFEICLKLVDFNESCKECSILERLNIDDLSNPCRGRIQEKFEQDCTN